MYLQTKSVSVVECLFCGCTYEAKDGVLLYDSDKQFENGEEFFICNDCAENFINTLKKENF